MNSHTRALFILLASLSLCSCATVKPPTPVAEAQAGLDTAVAAVKVSQTKAAKQAAVLVKVIQDPVVKEKATELQNTIEDMGAKLETATGKITWYEEQYATLYAHDADQTKIAEAQTVKAQEKAVEAHDNAKQRDVILYLFAVCMAAYLGTFFAGPVMREFPTPWNVIAASVAYLLVAVASYASGRFVLSTLARLIP
jgi:hypothetical protein